MKNRIVVSSLAHQIFEDIYQSGGYVYIVGGTVRDYLLKEKDSHDIDVEVYHMEYQDLKKILEKYGHVNTYGQSFAIMSLDNLSGYDFALPRREFKTGVKHQDFDIIVDKDLPIEKAILRRDITINALMYDYHKGQIIDLCNGIEDLKNGIIRMVNPQTFQEDPLRVLRVASFVSRFEMEVEIQTKQFCKRMVDDGLLTHLSIERIYEEYKKILMSNHPSLGLEFIKEIGALPSYLQNLVGCFQRLDYHPEGDVWNHTMLVVDIAALCKQYTDYPEAFMWSALLHDIGKPLVTTSTGSAPAHNESGVEVFKNVKIIFSHKLREYVKTMIMYHMHLMNMARNNTRDIKYLRLLKQIEGKVSLSDLMFISECDKLGRGRVTSAQYNQFLEYMNDKIERLGDKAQKPIIDGRDLIEYGFLNRALYRRLLDRAYDLQLQGFTKDKILRVLKKEELRDDKR